VTARRWAIEVESRANRDIERLDRPVRRRVLCGIERLAADPAAADIRTLSGRPESRLRVGSWRVLFELDRTSKTIYVKRVLPRGQAYRR
jgi:mRNA interferase RelE/StbE